MKRRITGGRDTFWKTIWIITAAIAALGMVLCVAGGLAGGAGQAERLCREAFLAGLV